MEKHKVKIKIECDNCYEPIEAEYKSGLYRCKCGRKIELEIIDTKDDKNEEK